MRTLIAVHLRAVELRAAFVYVLKNGVGFAVVAVVKLNAVLRFGIVGGGELGSAPEFGGGAVIGVLRRHAAGEVDCRQVGVGGIRGGLGQCDDAIACRGELVQEVVLIVQCEDSHGIAADVFAVDVSDVMRVGGGWLPQRRAAAVGIAVIAVVQRIAIGILYLPQIAIGEKLLVSVLVGQGVLCAGAGDRRAAVGGFFHVNAAAVDIIMLGAVAVGIDEIGFAVDRFGNDGFLQRQLPADADFHVVEVFGVQILRRAGIVASGHVGVVGEGNGERHHVAGITDQRHDQCGLHGEVADVGCACVADGGGLIGIIRLDTEHIAVFNGDARTAARFLRAVEGRPGADGAFVGGDQREADVGFVMAVVVIVAVVPFRGEGRNVPRDVGAGGRAAGRFPVDDQGVMRRGVTVIDAVPRQGAGPVFPEGDGGVVAVDGVAALFGAGQGVQVDVH